MRYKGYEIKPLEGKRVSKGKKVVVFNKKGFKLGIYDDAKKVKKIIDRLEYL